MNKNICAVTVACIALASLPAKAMFLRAVQRNTMRRPSSIPTAMQHRRHVHSNHSKRLSEHEVKMLKTGLARVEGDLKEMRSRRKWSLIVGTTGLAGVAAILFLDSTYNITGSEFCNISICAVFSAGCVGGLCEYPDRKEYYFLNAKNRAIKKQLISPTKNGNAYELLRELGRRCQLKEEFKKVDKGETVVYIGGWVGVECPRARDFIEQGVLDKIKESESKIRRLDALLKKENEPL